MNLKVMIADDDEGMRLFLRKLTEKLQGFVPVCEADNGEAVVRLFEEYSPDLIFMDVEMPFLNGVECAKRIMDINPKTIIIFATAHEEYMPEAFELYAFDYLVKPFKLERIKQTLQRVKALRQYEENSGIKQIIRHDKGLDKLVIKNKEGMSFVDMEEIILIQREDRSTAVYTSSEKHLTSEGLSEIEERLDGSIFFRSHKSYIINLSMIQKIYPYGRWTYIIKLKNTDKDALLTSEKYEELEKLF